jgi:hypothetical protein
VHANAIYQPHALVVLWAQASMEMANGCGSMLSGSVRLLRLSHSGAARFGGALLQQWHLWLVDPPPSVCEIVWRVVVLAAIWAVCGLWFIRCRKRLWSLVHTM